MKALVGTVLFFASLFLIRQILIGSGLLPPMATLVFLIGLVGIPFAGILLVESALDQEQRAIREEIDRLREEIAALRSDRSES